jgi:hypothetical protein
MLRIYEQARKVIKKFSYKILMIHGLKSGNYPKRYDLSMRFECTVYGSVESQQVTGKT